MKTLMGILLMAALGVSVQAAEPVPVWELNQDGLASATIQGEVNLADGAITLDGTNALSLPAGILGAQNDYTIEFAVTRPEKTTSGHKLTLVSNTDETGKAGLKLLYHPPGYNCGWLYTNGSMTVEYRGFLSGKAQTITIVAKDKQLMMFRNGLLLASTGEVAPSPLPLTFGAIEAKPTQPYTLRNIKVYTSAILPDNFDEKAERMRSYGGDQYFMQRVELKDPTLPRVLIIGDSISGGYRPFVSKALKGKANVDYWMIGYKYMGGSNSPMERALTGVLSNGPYDVVTFNFGLHYWGRQDRSPEDKHFGWMDHIVKHMKATSPKTHFVWIRTTPWRTTPDTGSPTLETEQNERIIRFNTKTDELMKANGVAIVDLYSIAAKQLHTVRKGSKDSVHWSREVSSLFADEILKEIERCLAAR